MRKRQPTPPVGTREIDRLAAEHYGGDTHALLRDYMYNGRSVESFVDQVTKEEAQTVVRLALEIREHELGGHENFQREILFQMRLSDLEMEKEAFLNTEKNPFKKSILLHFLAMVGVIAACVIAVFCGLPADAAGVLSSCCIGIVSLSMAGAILKCIKFRNTKTWYRKEYEAPKTDAVHEEDDTI